MRLCEHWLMAANLKVGPIPLTAASGAGHMIEEDGACSEIKRYNLLIF